MGKRRRLDPTATIGELEGGQIVARGKRLSPENQNLKRLMMGQRGLAEFIEDVVHRSKLTTQACSRVSLVS